MQRCRRGCMYVCIHTYNIEYVYYAIYIYIYIYGVCEQNYSEEEDPRENSHDKYQIRGWRGASAVSLTGIRCSLTGIWCSWLGSGVPWLGSGAPCLEGLLSAMSFWRMPTMSSRREWEALPLYRSWGLGFRHTKNSNNSSNSNNDSTDHTNSSDSNNNSSSNNSEACCKCGTGQCGGEPAETTTI